MTEAGLTQEELVQYRAVQSGLAWRDLSGRMKIGVLGPDRVEFLHAVISNDVLSLPDFAGRYGALLTATGKIVADFDYYRLPEALMIDVSRELGARLVTLLEGYIIMDDVTLEDWSGRFAHFAFDGPGAPGFLLELLGGPIPESIRRIVVVRWEEIPVWLIRKNLVSDFGFELLVPASGAPGFRQRMEALGREMECVELGPAALDVLRLERGIPLNGVDFSERNNPLEAQLTEAYSLEKGCYPGQEVVAKATNIGGVARLLVPVLFSGERPPSTGAALYSNAGKEIGRITSAGFSPRLNRAIGLALVKRASAGVGSRYEVESASEERLEGEIVASFP